MNRKFKLNDKVICTFGWHKGKKGIITEVFQGVNAGYTVEVETGENLLLFDNEMRKDDG